MKITRRQLRKIIKEAVESPEVIRDMHLEIRLRQIDARLMELKLTQKNSDNVIFIKQFELLNFPKTVYESKDEIVNMYLRTVMKEMFSELNNLDT
jgi:hypothetical protein